MAQSKAERSTSVRLELPDKEPDKETLLRQLLLRQNRPIPNGSTSPHLKGYAEPETPPIKELLRVIDFGGGLEEPARSRKLADFLNNPNLWDIKYQTTVLK